MRRVVFVCEHGAAKSVVAAALLPRIAKEAGVDLDAIARGTDPADELSAVALDGLRGDGVASEAGSVPQAIGAEDLAGAWRVVSFGPEIPSDLLGGVPIEVWSVPSVSDEYSVARDAIVRGLRALVREASMARDVAQPG